MVVDGALARASRFGSKHLAGGLDTWLIEARLPVAVMAPRRGYESCVQMRSQFALSLVRIDDLPDEACVRSATHSLAMGVLAREFKTAWLDDWVVPTVDASSRLLYAEFEALGDHTARAVSRAVAAGFAHGEMPLQGRHAGMAFYRAVRMVALALGQVTFAPGVVEAATKVESVTHLDG
jgi:hypothetical protein